MNKQVIIAAMVSRLEIELSRYARAARTAQTEATDEQSRAENKYDTRGLEASYLAAGQSRQVIETEQARELYLALPLHEFAPDEPIRLGALVELAGSGERNWYFLGPAAGGTEVNEAGVEVLAITPESPLGRLLIGKRRGDRVELGVGNSRNEFRVVTVL